MPPVPEDTESLAEALGGHLEGAKREVSGLCPPEAPRAGAVTVLTNASRLEAVKDAPLAAAVIPEGLEAGSPHPLIRVADTRLALAQLSALFDPRPKPEVGVDPGAHVHPSVKLGHNVSIGPGAVLEANVTVGENVRIGPNCVLGQGVRVGDGCLLHAGVILYDGVELGRNVTLHSGAVLGADGFGYAGSPQGAVKIHQLGTVIAGDGVEIGAGTCIDRATLGATRIGARSKVDNLCQIGHNAQIGEDCLIAGTTGIGGSTVLGRGVIVGGNVSFADHLTIGDGVRIAGCSGVTKNIPAGETWAGFPAQPYRKWVRELYLMSRLERIWQALKGRA